MSVLRHRPNPGTFFLLIFVHGINITLLYTNHYNTHLLIAADMYGLIVHESTGLASQIHTRYM